MGAKHLHGPLASTTWDCPDCLKEVRNRSLLKIVAFYLWYGVILLIAYILLETINGMFIKRTFLLISYPIKM